MGELTDDQWYAELVRICKENNYVEWLYMDREAIIADRADLTPRQFLDYRMSADE